MTYHETMRALGDQPGWQVTPPATHQAQMAEADEHETFDSPGDASPQGHSVQYHGGEVLSVAKLVVIWGGEKDLDKARFAQFCSDLMTAGYFDPARPYLNNAFAGSFLGAVEGPPITKTPFAQADALAYVQAAVAAGLVPAPDRHTIYSIMLPPGITAQLGKDQSCPSPAFCAYHFGQGDYLIDVEPDPTCAGCGVPPNAAFDIATTLLSHEVCETVEDPFGAGWFEDSTGMEPSDIVAWILLHFGPWTVQGYFGNENGGSNLLGAYNPPAPPRPTYQLALSGPASVRVGITAGYVATLTPPADGVTYDWFENGIQIPALGHAATAAIPMTAAGALSVRALAHLPDGSGVAAQLAVVVAAAPNPQPQSAADAVFAADVVALQQQQAADHGSVTITRAAAYAFGIAIVRWTQAGVDAALAGAAPAELAAVRTLPALEEERA